MTINYQPGDTIRLLDQTRWGGAWKGPMEVVTLGSTRYVEAKHPDFGTPGLFYLDEIELVRRPISVDEIKPGDFVTVRAQVATTADRRIDTYGANYEAADIISHEPAPEKPLAVGDRVEHVSGHTPRSAEYRIAFIEGDQLVLRSSGQLCLVSAKDWRRLS